MLSTIAAKEGAFKPESSIFNPSPCGPTQNCFTELLTIFQRLEYLEAAAGAFPKVSTFSIS